LIEFVSVPEWAARQRAALFFWQRRRMAYQRYTPSVVRVIQAVRLAAMLEGRPMLADLPFVIRTLSQDIQNTPGTVANGFNRCNA